MITVLVIKTSSLGDIIHTLPALSDAQTALPDIQFDWLVEENFAEIPAWHPAVRNTIPVAIRRWRKTMLKTLFNGEFKRFKEQLQAQYYDVVIDAQGLLKSAVLTYLAQGESYGLDKLSAREALAARFYQHPQNIARDQHAVERVRQLFAQSLGYDHHALPVNYNLTLSAPACVPAVTGHSRTLLFLHGTTWESKHWPESYWLELSHKLIAQGYKILLPWGNEKEYQRVLKIQQQCNDKDNIIVLDKMNLNQLAEKIANCDAVIAVDTGLAHLAAALDKPTIAVYGPTSPGLTGTYGKHQIHLQSDRKCVPCFKKHCPYRKEAEHPPCYNDIKPARVMTSLTTLLNDL